MAKSATVPTGTMTGPGGYPKGHPQPSQGTTGKPITPDYPNGQK